MEIPFYQVDAFARKVFEGNPAGVCVLDGWLDDSTLQAIACENNLPETAFLVEKDKGYEIRWFSPAVEIDLCGHATLAAAYCDSRTTVTPDQQPRVRRRPAQDRLRCADPWQSRFPS